jgi:hypothetical protein
MLIVPSAQRAKARIVKLVKFSRSDVEKTHENPG